MKKNEIRPDQFQNELKRLMEVDASRILSKCDNFVHVSCPACNSKFSDLFFERGFQINE